jgi:hypothetical protein
MFHADIGTHIGLDVEKGPKRAVGGIERAATIEVYYHHVNSGWART